MNSGMLVNTPHNDSRDFNLSGQQPLSLGVSNLDAERATPGDLISFNLPAYRLIKKVAIG
jgi:hypothetical protein